MRKKLFLIGLLLVGFALVAAVNPTLALILLPLFGVTQAATGLGTVLKVGDGGMPENFTALLESVNLAGPALSRETVDATHYLSADGFREHIAGLADGGEVSGEGSYIEDVTQAGLRADLESGILRNFQLVVPLSGGSKTWSFTGVVTQFEASYPLDDKMTYSFTIKISGKPTQA